MKHDRIVASSPDALCRCGHPAKSHHHGHSCTEFVTPATFKYCKCEAFREVGVQIEGEEGEEMAGKKVARVKSEKVAATPKLAQFVDAPFTIYLTHKEKEAQATVLKSGMIKYDGVEYKSLSGVGAVMAKDLGFKWNHPGWLTLKFNQDGKRVPLDLIRGSKAVYKVRTPRASKAVKAVKPKTKRVKKSRPAEEQSKAATA